MSKFNIVLLKRLSPTLNSVCENIEEQLNEIIDGKRHANDPSLDYPVEGKKAAGSMKMAGAWGEYAVLDTYVELLNVLNSGNINDVSKIIYAAKLAKNSIISIKSYLEELVKSNGNILAVKLWPVWSELAQFLNKRDVSINKLFIPYGDFSDINFAKVNEVDLDNTAEKIREQLIKDSEVWKQTQDREKAKNALVSMIESVSLLKELHHTHGYQEYWTALNARLVIALNDPNFELDSRLDLSKILDQAIIEVRNFGKNKKNVELTVIQEVMSTFLTEKAKTLALTNNNVSEVFQRFRIFDFLNEADNIVKNADNEKKNIFLQSIPLLRKSLGNIKESWTKHINNDVVKNDLLVYISEFFAKKEMLPNDPNVTPLLNGLINTFKFYKVNQTNERINEEAGKEFATLFFMLDVYLERNGQVASNFGEMAELQRNRLVLALEKKYDELSKTPVIEWDSESRSKESENALQTTIKELRKDYDSIEEDLNSVLSTSTDELEQLTDKERFEKLANLVKPLTTSAAIMRVLKHIPAVNVLQALTAIITNINSKQKKVITDQEREYLTVGLSSVGLFLEDLELGAKNPEIKLSAAVKLLFNKDLKLNKKETFKLKDVSELSNFNNQAPALAESIIEKEKETVEEEVVQEKIAEKDNYENEQEEVSNIDPLSFLDQSTEKDNDSINEIENVVEIDKEVSEKNNEEKEKEKEEDKTIFENLIILKEKEEIIEEKEPAKPETEGERQARELMPREISYDPNDTVCVVEDYIMEIIEDIPATLEEAFDELAEDPQNKEAMTTVRRTYHTLKGSGKQVKMFSMGYTAQLVEFRFNERLAKNVVWNSSLEKLSKETFELFTYWATELKEHQKVYFDPTPVINLLKEEEEFYLEMQGYSSMMNQVEKDRASDNIETIDIESIAMPSFDDADTSNIPDDINEIDMPNFNIEQENVQPQNIDPEEYQIPSLEDEENTEKEYSHDSFASEHKIQTSETSIDSLKDLASGFVDDDEENDDENFEDEENLEGSNTSWLNDMMSEEEDLSDISVEVDNLIVKMQDETNEVVLEQDISDSLIDAIEDLKDVSIKVGSPEMKKIAESYEDALYLLKGEFVSRDKTEIIESITKNIIDFLVKVNNGDILLSINENTTDLISLLTDDNNEILSVKDNNEVSGNHIEEVVLINDSNEQEVILPENNISENDKDISKAEEALDKIIESLRNMSSELHNIEDSFKELRESLSN